MARADPSLLTSSSWSPASTLPDAVETVECRSQSVSECSSTGMDPMKIPWYHPFLSRNLAEAELQKAEEGVYLMRPRFDQLERKIKGYAIDVRATHTVKHFQISVRPEGWAFGQETFRDIPTLLEHFDNKPLIGDDSGRLIVLRYPYPRDVDENPDYHSPVTAHFVSSPPKDKRQGGRMPQTTMDYGKTEDLPTIHLLSLASKAGYLVKIGAKVKSWKRRWFVLKDKYLSYYSKENEASPIREIDLSEVTEVSYDDFLDKPNLFKIVLPWRTFYLQAPSEEVRKEWVDLLNWRREEIQKLPEKYNLNQLATKCR